jgi:hypothetical protein
MTGAEIAAEIAEALAEAGEATGDGPLVCTLRKPSATGPETPWDETEEGAPGLSELTAIEDTRQLRDASGTLIDKTVRTLTVNATGQVPEESDEIAIGVAQADVDGDTPFETIAAVRTIAPGGIALMFELDLET